jgi:site-specific DNA-methyltransferase (adenine-specific)
MKPLALISVAVNNSSKENDVILDPFGGSGSTIAACEQLDRVCYTMELDPKYCDVIRKRYANLIGEGDKWELVTPPAKD